MFRRQQAAYSSQALNDPATSRGSGCASFLPAPNKRAAPILVPVADEVQRAYAQALLVDRAALEGFQNDNDALMARTTLKHGFRTDVEPILAMARLDAGGAIDPVHAYRASGYRAKVAEIRPALNGAGGGII